METLTIVSAQLYGNKKDGTPLVDRYGKAYSRAVITTSEYPSQMTGFVYSHLAPGMQIQAEVTEEDYMGKTQLRFNLPKLQNQTQRSMAPNASMMPTRAIPPVSTDTAGSMHSHQILQQMLEVDKEILNRLEAIYLTISTGQSVEIANKKAAKKAVKAEVETPEEDEAPMPEIDMDDVAEGDSVFGGE